MGDILPPECTPGSQPEDMCSPLSSFGQNHSFTEHAEQDGECKICFEVKPLPRFCSSCDSSGCCVTCLRTYFAGLVQDALYAMPIIRCPLCRGRVATSDWAPFVDRAVYDKYVGNASALLSLRCPSCDSTVSFAPRCSAEPRLPSGASTVLQRARSRAARLRGELQREELWCDLLAAREHHERRQLRQSSTKVPLGAEAHSTAVASALVDAWRRFSSTEAPADEFVSRLHCAWPPGRGARPSRSLRRAARKRVPMCIEDPERRMAAQLAWLRMYPKVRTPCCGAAVCFKCKVRGWHKHVTCEERQRQETGRNAQYCPNCQVPTTRSDGCTHIRCVCGTEWTWQERDDGSAAEMGPDDEDMDDDESDRSTDIGTNSCEFLRNRTAMELACMNPAISSKVIRTIAAAPVQHRMFGHHHEMIARRRANDNGMRSDPMLPAGYEENIHQYPRCPAGHALVPWGAYRTAIWVCDGCEEHDTSHLQRFRCEECDFDLCGACFVPVGDQNERNPEEDFSDSSSEPRTRRRGSGRGAASWGVRGRAVTFRPKARARFRRRPKADAALKDLHLEAAAGVGELDLLQVDLGSPSSTGGSNVAVTAEPAPDWDLDDSAAPLPKLAQGSVPEPSSSSSSRPDRPLTSDPTSPGYVGPVDQQQKGDLVAKEEAEDDPRREVPNRHLLPLHFAVRCGNVSTVATLLQLGAIPSEAALRELVKLPSPSLRRQMEEILKPHLDRVGKGALPLFARINFGLPLELPIQFDAALGTLPLMALRRQKPEVRESYGRELRQLLGEEWFQAAERESLTQELREELLAALQQRRLPDVALVKELLAAGADMQGSQPNCSDGESSHEGEADEDEKPAESEDSSQQERHDSSSAHWCPLPKQAQSCAELIAMQGDCTEEMFHWVFPPPPDGSPRGSASRSVPLWKRRRLLAISLWSCNFRFAIAALGNLFEKDEGLDTRIWDALRLMTDTSQKREDLEDAFREFISARGLSNVEVPLWALIQLGQKSDMPRSYKYRIPFMADDCHPDAMPGGGLPQVEEPDIATKLHREAESHMQAILAAQDPSAIPMDALAAMHKCLHKPTRDAFQELLQTGISDRLALQKRSNRAATRVLLWELRRAFCERRTPNLDLAKHLLESGARTRSRETGGMRDMEDTSDDDEEGGHPGGSRYTTDYDDAPRNSLDLLALNRFADPFKLQVAIRKAVECNADPKEYSSYERPLALAVRSRNVAAVLALLDAGAPVDRQALSALQSISDRKCRQEIEDRFLDAVMSGACSLQLKGVALWVLVQSGNIKATRRRLKSESTDLTVDAGVMMGLRRCRNKVCVQELRELLMEREGSGSRSLSSFEAQAATAELAIELREALIDQRGPDEEVVSELVALGANVQARNADLDSYADDEDTEDDDDSDE